MKAICRLVLVSMLMQAAVWAATVTLAWDAPTGYTVAPTGYNVYRSANADGSSATKLTATPLAVTVLTYSDATAPAPGSIYYYATAVYAAGESDKSNIVHAVVPAPVPKNVRVTAIVSP